MSLQFNVLTLLRESLGSIRRYNVEGDVLVDGTRQHVSGDMTFLRTQDGVLVTGELAGERHDPCSRCLRDVSSQVDIEVSEEYLTKIDEQTGAQLAPPEDPEAHCIDQEQTLDLEEAVRQSWMAAQPMQTLCKQECNGLCSRCGQDLNETDCACTPEADERWSGLQRLAKEMAQETKGS